MVQATCFVSAELSQVGRCSGGGGGGVPGCCR